MIAAGLHLTPIGGGNVLLEPSRSLDISDHEQVIVEVLHGLQQVKCQRLYYDLAELALIDPVYYGWLNMLARACLAINVKMVCIHMQPTAAFALSHFLKESPAFETALDVAERLQKVQR